VIRGQVREGWHLGSAIRTSSARRLRRPHLGPWTWSRRRITKIAKPTKPTKPTKKRLRDLRAPFVIFVSWRHARGRVSRS